MIEFNGNLSQKCKDFILRMDAKKDQRIVLPLLIIATPILVSGIFLWEFDVIISIGIWVGLFLFWLVAGIPRKKDNTGLLFPTAIRIKDGFIYAENDNKLQLAVGISSAYELVDRGDFYFIKVGNSLYTDPRFVCQKDLLVNGTIEQFENLFEGKITRLNK